MVRPISRAATVAQPRLGIDGGSVRSTFDGVVSGVPATLAGALFGRGAAGSNTVCVEGPWWSKSSRVGRASTSLASSSSATPGALPVGGVAPFQGGLEHCATFVFLVFRPLLSILQALYSFAEYFGDVVGTFQAAEIDELKAVRVAALLVCSVLGAELAETLFCSDMRDIRDQLRPTPSKSSSQFDRSGSLSLSGLPFRMSLPLSLLTLRRMYQFSENSSPWSLPFSPCRLWIVY